MSIRRNLVYAGRHFTPTWRYLFNLKSTLSYRFDQRILNLEELRIIEELNRNGVAVSSVEKLPGASSIFRELEASVESLQREHAERIATARGDADDGDIGRKSFLLLYLGEHPRLDPNCIYSRFALQPQILGIANAYFGMYTQLRYYNIWHTLTTHAPARESQLWHYDREDHLILKLFVYLSDVDEGAGPLNYAPGTHHKGDVKRRPDSFSENGVERWNDEQMKAIVPEGKWIRAIGPKGTIVFADTRGFHKGGLARTRDRLLYTAMFTSPTSQAPEHFERPKEAIQLSDKAQTLALAAPARGLFA